MSATVPLPLEQTHRQQLVYTFLNSTASYIIAFWIVYMISNLGACLLAGSWNWKSSLLYYGFNAKPADGIPFQRRAVVSVYALAPIICFGLAILARFAHFRYARSRNTMVKPILFWVIMHGINLSMGSTIISIIFTLMEQKRIYRGIGHALEWAHSDGIQLYFIITFVTVIEVASGFLLTLLSFQNAQHRTIFASNENSEKIAFTMANVVLPWLIGGFVTFIIRVPYITELDITLVFLMGSLVIPILSFTTYKHRISLAKTEAGPYFHLFIPLIIAAILLTLGIRVIFGDKGIMITDGL